ncbi:hypothetical protein L198_03167 [Cryptococcus wingfieldii CBS 7118]|uniref:Late embryogenesis abundant protein LEA-2 subgroup domain-containing protein n=1 Tax=Cryptococcus wingfieldii CBS 7118 TaxID=1295528 RepID=A0A1E3JIY7_9TREE|nr:hypothetical protein L198_03167 [Cryptococcus wingfieldii CBS 7118]ODO00840.1 hypothetical protein L198_03167 [Cryptococcus wingfieldii CBS 7118]
MAHSDPYNDPYGRQQQQYNTSHAADNTNYGQQPYHYQEENPYGEEPRYPTYSSDPTAGDYLNSSTEKVADESYPQGNTARAQPGRSGMARPTTSFAEMGPPPRSTGILRVWRKDERGKQWSRGGGVRTSLRFCCCTITTAIIMIISVVLAVLLYIRPPSVTLNSATVDSGSVSANTDGLSLKFDLNISVANPNWFDANFKNIEATVSYPGNNTNNFGGGSMSNVNFKGYTDSTFVFPFTLNYTLANDPDRTVLNDLISKCGILGTTTEDITVDYDLNLNLKILGLTVNPTISNSASFECPITESDIESIVGSSGLSRLTGS